VRTVIRDFSAAHIKTLTQPLDATSSGISSNSILAEGEEEEEEEEEGVFDLLALKWCPMGFAIDCGVKTRISNNRVASQLMLAKSKGEREKCIYRIFQLVQLVPRPNQSFSFLLQVITLWFDLDLDDELILKRMEEGLVHRLASREKLWVRLEGRGRFRSRKL